MPNGASPVRIRMGVGYLALGDSYTIGEGVAGHERWPVRLAALLRDAGWDLPAPQIIARSGWSTDELSAAIDAAEAAGDITPPYALVTLGIGVNDQYRGRTLDAYAPAFRMLLARAIALAGGDARRVLVASIPDWGGTPYARAAGRDACQVGREVDAFNAVAEAICTQRGVRFVDVTTPGRTDAVADALVDDGLHPSAAAYEDWAHRIAAALAPAAASH